MNETSQDWGKKLFEVLTIEQIQRLLDVVASSGILAQLDQTLRATDADLASPSDFASLRERATRLIVELSR